MIIGAIRRDFSAERVRVSARVSWESSDRRPLEIFFETGAEFESDFQANAEAFATAAIVPAMRHGEERLRVDGTLCPRLADGLAVSTALIRKWYGAPRRPVRLEPTGGFSVPFPRVPPRAAACMTGGIDSLHLLVSNRRRIPAEHPESIADALVVSGMLTAGTVESERTKDHFSRTCRALSRWTHDLNLTLVPVTTNVRDLDPDIDFLQEEFFSAAISSIAHLFSRRWSSLSLASGGRAGGRRLGPGGTHPLLDPGYGSGAVEIRHVETSGDRLARVRELASWGAEVENAIVCLQSPASPPLNCGKCEKCMRTMVELLIVGRLGRTREYPSAEITVEQLRRLRLAARIEEYWTELPAALDAMGRGDMARVIRSKLRRSRLKEALKSIDKTLTGGALIRRFRGLRQRAAGGNEAT